MFGYECLGQLAFEGVTAAILMAGLFLSFVVEYLGYRLVKAHAAKKSTSEESSTALRGLRSTEMMSVYIMEAGIIFHSLSTCSLASINQSLIIALGAFLTSLPVIGLTLVVAGDSFFLTLFAVIVFHQMFEGLALGSRIAALGTGQASGHAFFHGGHATGACLTEPTPPLSGNDTPPSSHVSTADKADGTANTFHVSMAKKLSLAAAFALVTPLGMAIGIGVLHRFNGNDPATIVAIGTLDAFSAGILLWVGVSRFLHRFHPSGANNVTACRDVGGRLGVWG